MGICGSKAESGSSKEEAPKRPKKLADDYILTDEVLGRGTFSVVKKVVHKVSQKPYACKCMTKSSMSKEDLDALELEVAVMKRLTHPNLVRMRNFYDEEKECYLVMELMTGGELFERIVEKEFFSEKEARNLVRVLGDTINYCHSQGVVHRDLKPENILLETPAENASIKIADFGFAKYDSGTRQLETACGTPGYVAPEILEGFAYGKEVDIWSVGVITYILLCGYPPFHNDNQAQMFEQIKRADFVFEEEYWSEVSNEAKDLISKMLVVDPAKRCSAKQILSHPWVTGKAARDVHLASAVTELKRFNARRKLKAGIATVVAGVRMKKLISGLKKASKAS